MRENCKETHHFRTTTCKQLHKQAKMSTVAATITTALPPSNPRPPSHTPPWRHSEGGRGRELENEAEFTTQRVRALTCLLLLIVKKSWKAGEKRERREQTLEQVKQLRDGSPFKTNKQTNQRQKKKRTNVAARRSCLHVATGGASSLKQRRPTGPTSSSALIRMCVSL